MYSLWWWWGGGREPDTREVRGTSLGMSGARYSHGLYEELLKQCVLSVPQSLSDYMTQEWVACNIYIRKSKDNSLCSFSPSGHHICARGVFLCPHRCPQSSYSWEKNHFGGQDIKLEMLSCFYHNSQWIGQFFFFFLVFAMSRGTVPLMESKQGFKVMRIESSYTWTLRL